MKSFETGPIGDAAAIDSASNKHELIHLGTSSSDRSSTVEEEIGVESNIVDSDLVVYEEEVDNEVPQRRRFSPPTREQLLTWLPFWGVILLGAVLRFWGLGDKPLHHDESLHAYYSLQLLNNMAHWTWCVNPPPQGYSCYIYTPLLHGP
ncbi:MAG TPA: hypothetical protein VEH81_07915, partial [Ktedonobacteraceae bacterium]|nr:hypothetical protein [Ktedonobacteraceae bacterium]